MDVIQNANGLGLLRYTVDMPNNTYIGFCYGTSMFNTDMVAFVSTTQMPAVGDLYSYSEDQPIFDRQ